MSAAARLCSAALAPPQRQVLQLEDFGVAYGARVVLAGVRLDIPERQVTTLLGPAGGGKSTLLRTLAGLNNANPQLRVWGRARYLAAPLGVRGFPALVAQQARLLMASVLENVVHNLPGRSTLAQGEQRAFAHDRLAEAGLNLGAAGLDEPVVNLPLGAQRLIAIIRFAVAQAPLLCLDEPTTGLAEDETARLLAYVRLQAGQRAVLIVLHNQRHAGLLGGSAALLAGGQVVEQGPVATLLQRPQTSLAQDFVRSGSCCAPAPGTPPEALAPDAPPPTALPAAALREVARAYLGPRGFLWIKPGVLAGTPRPGIVAELEHDLEALQRVGVTALISLTRTPVDTAALARYGIAHHASPIPDMCPPELAQARAICERMQALIAAGHCVAVHCRAGLGRTGTILASYLIWEGQDALDALDQVRGIEPRYVQSASQAVFLEEFARWLRRDAPPPVVCSPARCGSTPPSSFNEK